MTGETLGLPGGWAAPEMYSVEREGGREIHVDSPDGPIIVVVEAMRCGREVFDDHEHYLCGRVFGHNGPCWIIMPEYAEKMRGALAVVRSLDLVRMIGDDDG